LRFSRSPPPLLDPWTSGRNRPSELVNLGKAEGNGSYLTFPLSGLPRFCFSSSRTGPQPSHYAMGELLPSLVRELPPGRFTPSHTPTPSVVFSRRNFFFFCFFVCAVALSPRKPPPPLSRSNSHSEDCTIFSICANVPTTAGTFPGVLSRGPFFTRIFVFFSFSS